MYKQIIRPLFFQLDPENAHHLAMSGMRLPLFDSFVRPWVGKCEAPMELWNLKFRNPVGLAGGFDKDARILSATQSLGFGFTEIGTVTPRPQPGNPKPRIFRLPDCGGLINRLGFPNDGANAIAKRLHHWRESHPGHFPVGINIGKNKQTLPENAPEDYLAALSELYPHGDFFVVNVSSPNTPGLRDLQSAQALREILAPLIEFRSGRTSKPLLVKIAPDLAREDIASILELVQDLGLDGIVATNTTIDHGAHDIGQKGGLSGKPLEAKSTDIIRFIHQQTNGQLPIIGVGGITSRDDYLRKMEAGASLVQLYTGFVYQGPLVVKQLLKG
jgi:dihydroorotate dehydrogenase